MLKIKSLEGKESGLGGRSSGWFNPVLLRRAGGQKLCPARTDLVILLKTWRADMRAEGNLVMPGNSHRKAFIPAVNVTAWELFLQGQRESDF